MDFSSINGVVMDMDGVLWRGDQALPGVAPFFDLLRARGLPFALASNNSAKTPADYVAKLAARGIERCGGTADRHVGHGDDGLSETHYPAGAAVHVLGGDGLRAMVSTAGFVVSDEARIVVAGIDFKLTYEKLKRATYLIRSGADFIGTNDDATFPMPDGLSPGAGSIIARFADGDRP